MTCGNPTDLESFLAKFDPDGRFFRCRFWVRPSAFEQGRALSRLVEGINNDPEHDEGGWIAVHSRKRALNV